MQEVAACLTRKGFSCHWRNTRAAGDPVDICRFRSTSEQVCALSDFGMALVTYSVGVGHNPSTRERAMRQTVLDVLKADDFNTTVASC